MRLSLGYFLRLATMHAITDASAATVTHGPYFRLDQQALAVVGTPDFRGPY